MDKLKLICEAISKMPHELLCLTLEVAARQEISNYLNHTPMPPEWSDEQKKFVLAEMLAMTLTSYVNKAAEIMLGALAEEKSEQPASPEAQAKAEEISAALLARVAKKEGPRHG